MESRQHLVQRLDNSRYRGIARSLEKIQFVVWHATVGGTALSSIAWMNRPDSTGPSSYHYIVERNGIIYRHTPIEFTAYHAGDSWWPNPVRYPPGNRRSLNPLSIGIAFANRNDGEELTREQRLSGLWLGLVMMAKLDIPPSRNIGHVECSPGRKTDPRAAIRMSDWRAILAAGELLG